MGDIDYVITGTIHDIIANDDHVVLLANAHATRNGKTLDYRVAEIYHLKNGMTPSGGRSPTIPRPSPRSSPDPAGDPGSQDPGGCSGRKVRAPSRPHEDPERTSGAFVPSGEVLHTAPRLVEAGCQTQGPRRRLLEASAIWNVPSSLRWRRGSPSESRRTLRIHPGHDPQDEPVRV